MNKILLVTLTSLFILSCEQQGQVSSAQINPARVSELPFVVASPEPALPQGPQDLSQRYQEYLITPDEGFPLQELKKYRVIFVPGFLAETLIGLGGDYFDEQMDWLASQGVDVERLRLESEAPIEVNAPEITKAIASSSKKVILITHSKGGLDTLAGFLEDPRILENVYGWVPVQSPFHGTPVADWVLDSPVLGTPAVLLLKAFGGGRATVQTLKTKERADYLQKHDSAIGEIAKKIRLVTYGSYKDNEKGRIDSQLETLRNWIVKYASLKNDGTVPAESSKLPYADHVVEAGVDHFVTTKKSRYIQFDRIAHTRALLRLLLD